MYSNLTVNICVFSLEYVSKYQPWKIVFSYLISGGDAEKGGTPPPEGTENPTVNHHASTEYINNSPEMKKEKPKEDTPV